MAEKKLFVDDVGINFRVYAGIDLSDATSIIMKIMKPSGQTSSWTASLDGTNNYYATYDTVANDLNEEGTYLLSLVINKSGGVIIKGESAEFKVYTQFYDIP